MEFINYLKKNNYSVNTITTYKNILNNYTDIFHDIRLIKKKITSYEKSPNTAWTHYNVLLSFMKFSKDKRIGSLKELKLPQIPMQYRKTFTKKYLYNQTNDMNNQKHVVIRFLFETGIRACELKNIIKISNKTIIIKGKGNKIREIFHNMETTSKLIEFTYTLKTLRIWVKEILGDGYSPHSIRRSFATHMLLNGANPKSVMLQLGHAKVETTYRYLQLSFKENQKIYNKCF